MEIRLISLLMDTDPHSQYESGSRRAKSIQTHAIQKRIRIHKTVSIPLPYDYCMSLWIYMYVQSKRASFVFLQNVKPSYYWTSIHGNNFSFQNMSFSPPPSPDASKRASTKILYTEGNPGRLCPPESFLGGGGGVAQCTCTYVCICASPAPGLLTFSARCSVSLAKIWAASSKSTVYYQCIRLFEHLKFYQTIFYKTGRKSTK